MSPLAQQRLRGEQPILTLPRLQAADDADHRHVRCRRELDRGIPIQWGVPTWIGGERAHVGSGRSGGNDERLAARSQPLLGVGGRLRVAADRTSREQRRTAIQPVAIRDPLLPPHDASAHARERRGRRAVQLRLGCPVEDQVGLASTQDRRQAHDGHDPPVSLAEVSRGDHLDAKAGVDQLLGPRPVLEEHELELVSALLRPVEDRLQHRLGAAETLPPRQRHHHAHELTDLPTRERSPTSQTLHICSVAGGICSLTLRLLVKTITAMSHTPISPPPAERFTNFSPPGGLIDAPDEPPPARFTNFSPPGGLIDAPDEPPPARFTSFSPPEGVAAAPDEPPPARFTKLSPSVGRVGLSHDYLLVMRGAERTFAAIADLYSQAPIYTLLYDAQGTGERFAGRSIATSPLQRLGVGQSGFRRLLPLYPAAVERLRPTDCDVVISSSSAFAHGLRVPDEAVHICYCYTPFRYAWDEEECALGEVPSLLRPLLRRQLRRIRRWDLAASRRVDSYIAISELSRERIKRCYGRDAPVIHPPVETHRFAPGAPGDSLLVVSEFVRHKRLHIALEAAQRARVPIRVVGSGPDRAALSEAYPKAEFLGRVDDEDLVKLYAEARAVVVPSLEEFGITAVEAQAAGRPVIATAAGGTLETVLDGQTGRLARLDDVEDFVQAIRDIDKLDFDPARATENAERFSVAAFQRRLHAHVSQVVHSREGSFGEPPLVEAERAPAVLRSRREPAVTPPVFEDAAKRRAVAAR